MIKIANFEIGKRVFIIAEAGVNHNGDFNLAKKLVDVAAEAGADSVKFQTFKTDLLVSKNTPKAKYQKKNSTGRTQFEMLKDLELSKTDFMALKKHCSRKGIIFLSAPFDSESAKLLNEIRVAAFKIGSGEITNFPLLKQIARYQKPVILSTGMATVREIKKAVLAIKTINSRLILLHCTSSYPTPFDQVNLRAIRTLQKEFSLPIGYSDHTTGIEVPIAATALGACVIEKHFTLDRNLPGPDHPSSLEPNELKAMIAAVRHIETALGDGKKKPQINESAVAKVVRKSLFAACDIKKGENISKKKVAIKRPETGIRPEFYYQIIGKTAKTDIKKDESIRWESIKK